jgi:formylmethanofuran dehydrogenase subunit E
MISLFRKFALSAALIAAASVGFAHEDDALPHSHWRPQPSDPAWVVQAAQFHGHLGPWVVAGARLGMAAAKAVEAKSHFEAEVICEGPFEKPPQSCFLDGIQLGSGATLGKRSLQVVNAKSLVVRVRNPNTGERAEIRPTQKLLDLLTPSRLGRKKVEMNMADVERIARSIVVLPDEDICTVKKLEREP